MICTELGIFALYSVHQNPSFHLSKSTFRQFFQFFTLKGGPLWFLVGQKLLGVREKISKKNPKNQTYWTNWNRTMGGRYFNIKLVLLGALYCTPFLWIALWWNYIITSEMVCYQWGYLYLVSWLKTYLICSWKPFIFIPNVIFDILYQGSSHQVKVGPTPFMEFCNLWRIWHMSLDILELKIENPKIVRKTVLVMSSQIFAKIALIVLKMT